MSVTDFDLPAPRLLLAVTGVEAAVLLGTGSGLLLVPGWIDDIWPWVLTPFNARFLGAIYLSSFAAVAAMLVRPRWAPARVLVPMILTFTAVVLAVSLLSTDRFRGGQATIMTTAWFVLYVVIPGNAAWHLWRYRDRSWWGGLALPTGWLQFLRAQAAIMGAYGIAVLAAGAAVTGFWPWPIDDFHARIYSAVFLTGSVGLWLLTRGAPAVEVATIGITQGVLGSLSVLGLILVDWSVSRVDWGAGGTWLWISWFSVAAIAGLALALYSRRHEARLLPPMAGSRPPS